MGGRIPAPGQWKRGCGSLLALALAVLCCRAAPLLPKGCTLVLLCGLAGDAESEATYRTQLQAWQDLAAASGQPKQIVVLCDAPDEVKPVAGTAKVLKNDRKTFLGLAESLAGSSNALVVIAWGHGGKQGSIPVLHVRGPRLTPSDFFEFAKKLQPSSSQWILLFRGSGAFAHQLAGPEVHVVSSDLDQIFNSDPVGMPMLLKLARSPAATSFETLAREFGAATTAWYQERSLARTEEPALWIGDEKPQLLASNSDAAPKERAETSPGSQPAPNNDGTAARAEVDQKPDSPPAPEKDSAWAAIKKVQPADYADFEAVVLEQRLSCRLGTSPALSTEQEEFIQILTPEGKSMADFDISFHPPAEEIEFDVCEVLRPDGKLVRLDPEKVGESRDQPLGDYEGERRKFFSLPGAVPGSILHVRYRTEWMKFPLPQISMALPIGKEVPCLRSTVQVSVPKQSAFHWAIERVSAPDPAIKNSTYAANYTWHFTNVPAHGKEILSGPGQTPRLLFSTFQDWGAFADWYGRISQLSDVSSPEIEGKARELTSGAKNDREKLLALYNYVTGLRYVAVPLGINSVRPHAAGNVLQNQFGDCKDKANLLKAMLRSLQIDSHLVLVPRFTQAHDDVPGLAFNHAISQVKLGSEIIWVDTTDDVCRFGMLPPGDNGRKVLVIDGQARALTTLPAADPKQHRLVIDGEVRSDGSQEALGVSLKAVAYGYPDYELRSAAREVRENRASLPILAARFRPAAGVFALTKQTSTPVSALEENFTWTAEGACVGLATGKGQTAVLHSPFWLPKEWDLALHHRQSPLFLNQGYPLRLEQKFKIALSEGAKAAALPQFCENSQGPLRWRVQWVRIGDDTLGAEFKAEFQGGELSSDESAAFQEQVRGLLAALGADAALNYPAADNRLPKNGGTP